MSGLAVTWWGHATTTLELGGVRVAIDPLLDDRLLHLTRRGPSPTPAAAQADLVLVSHLHADHCHLPSLRRFGAGVPMVVPRGSERLLAGLGARRLVPVAPGERHEVAGVDVQVLGATHDGRRLPWSGALAPALGFRVAAGGVSVWFPGDTGPRDDLERVEPVDLALAPIGGWGPSLGEGHLDPGQAAEAVARVGARRALGVHWGTFWPVGLERLAPRTHRRLFVTPGDRFERALTDAGVSEPLRLGPGERARL